MHCRVVMLSALILVLAASVCPAEPLRILLGRDASEIERYAAGELRDYLGQVTDQPVAAVDGTGTRLLLGTPASNPRLAGFAPALPAELEPQEIIVRSGTLDGGPAVAIVGGSPQAALWAAYALLEQLGVVFEFSGEIIPAQQATVSLDGIDIRRSPSIEERGLRLHLNFPMDQSAYSLPDFLQWVDRMARMKYNYVMLHMYSAHPWFYFKYRDAETRTGTFFVGSHMFGGRYDLPPDMVARGKIHNRAQYFPPEFEGMSQGLDLYRRTEERMHAVIDHCHARGIKVALSFEPLSPPGDIRSHLGEWEKDAGGRDALMRDLTVQRLLACMDAYPNADEFQLISVEGSNDAPGDLDLKADLKRLCGKYQIPFDVDDEAQFAGAKETGVNLSPYNAPETAQALDRGLYRPVVSALRFVDLALEVFADERVSRRMAAEGKQPDVGIYLPHARAIELCTPALRVMIPKGGRLQLMVDYGARGTADQMKTWEAFRGADMQLGIISWLEFDGSMFLPQAWPRAVHDCVENAGDLPVTTMVGNHWRVSGLEADAACLAQAPWSPDQSADAWLDGYLTRVFGEEAAKPARDAYDALEQATLYCRAHLFNVGFCYEGRYRGNFGYPAEHTDAARSLYTQAAEGFEGLADSLPEGRPKLRAGYLANRCRCAVIHLNAMDALARAEAKLKGSPDTLADAAAAAEEALRVAREYMQTYSEYVLDRGDEGMLVNYHFGLVERAEGMAQGARQAAVIALADPVQPIVRWSFDKPESLAVDDTGNGFDASPVGEIEAAPGKRGQALHLNGDAYLQVDTLRGFSPEALTIAAWINPEKTSARRGIVVKRIGNVASPFVFGLSDGALRLEGCDTSNEFWPFNFSGPAIPANTWTHVAMTLTPQESIVLYVDGEPVASKAIAGSPQPNNEPIVIGREAWGGEGGHSTPAFFQGLLDEVAIWKRALSAEEIKALASP